LNGIQDSLFSKDKKLLRIAMWAVSNFVTTPAAAKEFLDKP